MDAQGSTQKPEYKPAEWKITLRSALGLLFNRREEYKNYLYYEPYEADPGGAWKDFGTIYLPCGIEPEDCAGSADYDGTGNIVIKGSPGSGKTTLALQIAMACANFPNNRPAVYYSLEEPPETILNKVKNLGWNQNGDIFRKFEYIGAAQEEPSDDDLKSELKAAVGEYAGGPSCVLLPEMSPRGMTEDKPDSHGLFFERYHQLEKLLRAARKLRQDEQYAPAYTLGVVCIDSLSVFGDRPLSREEIHMLFELFKHYRVLGIFVAEANEFNQKDYLSDYIGDVVIKLEEQEEYGHLFHYVCIEKSRYQPQVFGRHPYRIITPKRPDETGLSAPLPQNVRGFNDSFAVYPSVHYLISNFKKKGGGPPTADSAGTPLPTEFFDKQFALKSIGGLFPLLIPTDNYIVSVMGPQSSYKTEIAKNFLVGGMLEFDIPEIEFKHKKENVLLINLNEYLSFNRGFRKSQYIESMRQQGYRLYDIKVPNKKYPTLKVIDDNPVKLEVAFWKLAKKENEKRIDDPMLLEMAFKSGALLPEEFLDYVLKYVMRYQITRVAIDDIGRIGVCYPCLKNNKITGDMFLPALIRLLNNCLNMKLLILGTTGRSEASQSIIEQARTLSDATLTTSVDRDFIVGIEGEGLIARQYKGGGAHPYTIKLNVPDEVKSGFEENVWPFIVDDKPKSK